MIRLTFGVRCKLVSKILNYLSNSFKKTMTSEAQWLLKTHKYNAVFVVLSQLHNS